MGNIEKFDQMAERYDTDERAEIATIIASAIRRRIPAGGYPTALDYGCGTGLVSMHLLDLFGHALLVDASANMVDQVNRKLRESGISNAKAVCCDLMADPPFALHADCIIVVQVLLHIKDTLPLLVRLLDVLNPGGQLLIVDFVTNELVVSSEVHSGFDPVALSAQLKSLGCACADAEVIHRGERIFMNQDASLFLIDARKGNFDFVR